MPTAMQTERTYRNQVTSHLTPVRVVVQETDLTIYADHDVAAVAKETVMVERGYLEQYIRTHPNFIEDLTPWPDDALSPGIVKAMIAAGRCAHVGPMAAVAGAVAEAVGNALLAHTNEVIVENGGDVFLHCLHDTTVAIYANQSPLSLKVGVRIAAGRMPIAVCTSSGTVGHSLSMGRSDAVCVVSASAPLADAAATAIGNRVREQGDIEMAIEWGRQIKGLDGGVVIIGNRMGVWGNIEMVPLKKG